MESNTSTLFSSSNTIAVILLVGLLSSILVGVRSCNVRDACVSERACYESDRFSFCSFSNVVTVTADSTYSASGSSAALHSALRRVCSPGDRFQKDAITGDMRCIPYYPFPSALNEEIMDPSASKPHMKACGKWIEAGEPSPWGYSVSRPNENHEEWLSALGHAENAATASSSNAKDSMSKFRSECARTVTQGSHATRNTAVMAYNYLDSEISKVDNETSLLLVIGFMAGHYCEAPVEIDNWGLDFDDNLGSFHVRFSEGFRPASGVLAEAMQLVSLANDVQESAEVVNRAITNLSATISPEIGKEWRLTLLNGATSPEYVSNHTDFPFYGSSSVLAATVSHYSSDPSGTLNYLRGVAAFCSVSLLSNVENVGTLTSSALQMIKGSGPPPTSLRQSYTEEHENVINQTLLKSTKISLSTLSGYATGDVDSDCLQLMRKFFPDDIDESRFAATVDHRLYERLESLVERARAGMQEAVMSWPLNDTLTNASRVASRVERTGIRISGAPRGSWAGLQRPIPDPGFSSFDGMFVMALKQARAIFMDNIAMSLEKTDRCDGVLSLGASVAMNAYLWYGEPACSNLFLGMATRPFLDAQYDDESLMSRGVNIIAHELGHVLGHMLWFPDEFDVAPFQTLLQKYNIDYAQSYTLTYQSEAMADLAGALAVIKSGVDKERFLMHFCQIWCARVPFGWEPYPAATHPEHNQRCDFLYQTLTDSELTP